MFAGTAKLGASSSIDMLDYQRKNNNKRTENFCRKQIAHFIITYVFYLLFPSDKKNKVSKKSSAQKMSPLQERRRSFNEYNWYNHKYQWSYSICNRFLPAHLHPYPKPSHLEKGPRTMSGTCQGHIQQMFIFQCTQPTRSAAHRAEDHVIPFLGFWLGNRQETWNL